MDQRFGNPGVDPLGGAGHAAGGESTSADATAPAVKPPPPVAVTVVLGLLAPMVTGIVGAILVLVVAACLPGAPRGRGLIAWTIRSAPGLAALLLVQNALLVLWAWWLAKRRPLPPRNWLRLHPVRLDGTSYLLLLVMAAGVLALGALAALAGREIGLPGDTSAVDRINDMMRAAPGISWLVLVLALGLGPGFGEEIWVRGHLLRSLEAHWRMRWAIVGSAVLFAVLHLDPAHMVFALPFGLVFGWLTIRTDSVLPGILCHAFVNSGVNLVRAIAVRRPGWSSEVQAKSPPPGEIAAALGVVGLGVIAALLLEHRFRHAARVEPDPVDAVAGGERP